MGWLTLPYERFSSSRFELAVQKSIGLFSSYGDLAQFVAYFMLLAFFVPASLFATHQRKGRMLIYLVAIAVIVIGIIGNQSRSLVLSLLAAIFMAKIFQYRTKSRTNRLAFNMLFISIATSAAAVATALLSRITTFLGRMGGGQAEQTAMSRLDQYQYALKVIDAYPILGAEGSYYRRFEIAIDGIHNMWLGQLARGGFASALLLFILLLIIFRASLKLLNDPHAKQYGLVAIGYMFALLAATLFYPANSALFWALLGTNTAILATLKSSSLHQ
jgi:O-antigen ligase